MIRVTPCFVYSKFVFGKIEPAFFFFIESNRIPNAVEEHFRIFPRKSIPYLLVSLMYVDFLNVGKHHSLLLSVALHSLLSFANAQV